MTIMLSLSKVKNTISAIDSQYSLVHLVDLCCSVVHDSQNKKSLALKKKDLRA